MMGMLAHAVHVRKSEIQKDQVGALGGNDGMRLLAGVGRREAVVLRGQCRRDKIADIFFVFN